MRRQLPRVIAIAVPLIGVVVLAGARAKHPPAAPPAQAAPVTQRNPAPLDVAGLQKKVDELIDGHSKTNGFSGSVLLAKDGKPLVSKGYGFANVEWQVPNTTATKFRIGSITKQFTSMIIMQLREQGKIKLEDSTCAYVVPCPAPWKAVTIHHLLTHTSRHPDLHRHSRLARGEHDAENDRSDHRVRPRFAAPVDAR